MPAPANDLGPLDFANDLLIVLYSYGATPEVGLPSDEVVQKTAKRMGLEIEDLGFMPGPANRPWVTRYVQMAFKALREPRAGDPALTLHLGRGLYGLTKEGLEKGAALVEEFLASQNALTEAKPNEPPVPIEEAEPVQAKPGVQVPVPSVESKIDPYIQSLIVAQVPCLGYYADTPVCGRCIVQAVCLDRVYNRLAELGIPEEVTVAQAVVEAFRAATEAPWAGMKVRAMPLLLGHPQTCPICKVEAPEGAQAVWVRATGEASGKMGEAADTINYWVHPECYKQGA